MDSQKPCLVIQEYSSIHHNNVSRFSFAYTHKTYMKWFLLRLGFLLLLLQNLLRQIRGREAYAGWPHRSGYFRNAELAFSRGSFPS